MYHIGSNIKNAREQRGFSVYTLANALQVSVEMLIDWEANVSQPNLAQLHDIAQILEVTTDFLIDGKPPNQSLRYIRKHKSTITNGISFGACLAMVISFVSWNSIPWAILHGLFGWFYVIYYFFRY